MIEWQKVTEGMCRRLADVPAGARIESVNSRTCFGMCEVCGRPIIDRQRYESDDDGIMWHKRCRVPSMPNPPPRARPQGDAMNKTTTPKKHACRVPFGHTWSIPNNGHVECLWCNKRKRVATNARLDRQEEAHGN
jgi:hypothetical protein